VLPDLTSPQALAALEQMLNEGERRYMGGLLASEATLGPMVRSFCGRLYFNLSQLRRVCAIAGQPAADLLRSFGHGAAIQASDEIVPPVPLRDRLAVVPDFVRLVVRHLRAEWYVRAHATSMQAWVDRFSPDPAMMQDEEIWTAMEAWRADAPSAIETVLMLGGVTFHEAPVQKACKRVGFSYERLVYPQLAAGERSVSAQQAFDLLALAATAGRDPAVVEALSSDPLDIDVLRRRIEGSAFLRELDRFLNAYGHRGRYESDWALPRYAEDPTPLLQAIRSHVQAGTDTDRAATLARQQRESAEAWTAFEQALSPWQRWFLLPRIRRSVRMAKQYYLWRERVRSEMVRVMSRVRRWHLELANRFVKRGWLERRDDYFLLHLEEIGAAIGGTRDGASLHDTVAVRAAALERHQAIQMPLLMRESDLPRLVRLAGVSSRPGTDAELSGHPVSAGVVEAEVVIVRDPADFGRMKAGAILVARATDPSWTPLFTLASGVIVEIGGVLSHASTIAREYGLPAVANVRNATRLLSTGERVRLDATTGIISRLGRERVFATVA
jgi:phosphohistidine swiveling domain-containing protein